MTAAPIIALPDTEMTEEDWVRAGRDLARPWAVEAPRRSRGHGFEEEAPRHVFREGEIVVLDCRGWLPVEILSQDPSQSSAAMSGEIWGRVMGTAVRRHGQYGGAVRDGEGYEVLLRVRCERWVAIPEGFEGAEHRKEGASAAPCTQPPRFDTCLLLL